MEKLQRGLILVPAIVAAVQLIKQTIPERFYNYLWILTLGLGVVSAYGYVAAMEITTMNNAMIIFGGILAGLAASGTYEFGKNVIKTIKG